MHYDPITKKDMIQLGGIHELLGRFPLVVNFQKLSEEAIDKVIDKNLREVGQNLQMKIELSPAFRKTLHESANSSFGCRQLSAIIMDAVMPRLAESLRQGNPGQKIVLGDPGEETFREEWMEDQEESEGEI